MKNKIVISRYNEELTWVNKLDKKYEILIYNKGNKIPEDLRAEVINIKNVGRESHTWVYHIYHNYENLDSNTLFLQGRIDDLGCMSFKNIEKYFFGLEKNTFCASRLGILTPFHWKKNLNIEFDNRYKKDWNENKIARNRCGFRLFSLRLLGELPIFLPTSYGGCFAVTKEALVSYPKSFYLELLKNLNYHMHPIEAHYMERLWCYMFSKKLSYKKAILDVLKTKLERNIFRRQFI